MHKKINVSVLAENNRRLEGILVILGSLADADDSPELEAVHDLLLEVIDNMRTVLNADGKDME